DYCVFIRSSNTLQWVIDGAERMTLTVDGLKLSTLGARVSKFSTDGTMVGNSATAVPVESAVKAYVDASNTSNVIIQGGYDAATNTPDLDSSPIAGILKGHMYSVTVGGSFFAATVEIGDQLVANQDSPTLESHWIITNKNVDAPSVKILYESNGNTNAFTDAEKASLATMEDNADVTDLANVGSSIWGAPAKTTPIDADTFPLNDTAAANV
ncbi:MAG: hypothetical protein GY761_06355, partial [Hyphomicrobiales bacterium]|nr:hypothetical protein [Hyphomicrobiales bacterium]